MKVEPFKHLMLPACFLLPLWQCWSSRVGNSQRSWNAHETHPDASCQADVSRRLQRADPTRQLRRVSVWWRNESVFLRQTSLKHLCICYVFIFVCERKKLSVFHRGDKTRVASISSISPPSCTRVLLCFYLWFLPCCVAVVHPQMNLAACSAAAWCIVTFSNEPILMRRPGFLCAAIACCCSCCSMSFIICDSWGK